MSSEHRVEPTLRVIHAALTVGAMLVVGILFLLGRMRSPVVPDLAVPLRTVGFAVGLGAILVFMVFRGRIRPPEAGEDAEVRRRRNAATALVLWAVLDGLTTLGGICWYLTREPVLLATPTGVGLVLLIAARPRALPEG